jgi:hypothetical protein
MTPKTLVLRLSRRAIAAAMLSDEELMFFDGRHISSQKGRAVPAASRYIERVLSLTTPTAVLIDGPTNAVSTTASVLESVRSLAANRKLSVRLIALSDVLESYGLPGLPSRVALRKVVDGLWPQIAAMTRRVRPYVADAAAVTLYAESQQALSMPPP